MLSIEQLVDKITKAALHGQHIAEEEAIQHLDMLFNEEDGILCPKRLKMDLGLSPFEVARMSFRILKSIAIQDMRFRVETNLSLDENGEMRTDFKPGLRENEAHVEIEIGFEARDGSEGIMQVQEMLTGMLADAIERNVPPLEPTTVTVKEKAAPPEDPPPPTETEV